MPIRPENRERYPKNWRTVVVPRIRERSGNRCECLGECGLRHVYVNGAQIDLLPELQVPEFPPIRCTAVNGAPHPVTKSNVVLTVGHLNHAPEDCRDEVLKHWCQRCHNRYDALTRAKGIRERRRAASPQADMLAGADAGERS